MAVRPVSATSARRRLANVTAALEHALARERAQGPPQRFEPRVLAAQVRVAMLRAQAAQLRRAVASGHARAESPALATGVLPFVGASAGDDAR